MATIESASPLTSTPSQKLPVAKSTALPSSRNRFSNASRGASPRTSTGKGGAGKHARQRTPPLGQAAIAGVKQERPSAAGGEQRRARLDESLGKAGVVG